MAAAPLLCLGTSKGSSDKCCWGCCQCRWREVAACGLGRPGLGALQGRLHVPFVGRTRWGHWMLCSCGPRTWLGPFPPTLGLASPWTELPRVGTPFWSVAAVSGDSGLPCEGPCPCVPVLSLTLYPGLRGKSGQRFQLLTRRFGAGMRAPREPRVSGAWGGHAGQRSLQLRAGLGPAPARRRRGGRRVGSRQGPCPTRPTAPRPLGQVRAGVSQRL